MSCKRKTQCIPEPSPKRIKKVPYYNPSSDRLNKLFKLLNYGTSIKDMPEYLTDDNMDYLAMLVYCSYFGYGVPKNNINIGKLLNILNNLQKSQKSASKEENFTHTFSKILLWILTKEPDNFTETILAMAEGPLEGHMYAIMIYVYRNGILGCEVNHEEAYNYAIKSAACDNVIGKAWVGFYLLRGEVVEKDIQRSEQLLLESANLGFSMAQHEIGLLYLYINPTRKNICKGLQYLEEAAYNYHNRSITLLGDICRVGQIPFKDENGTVSHIEFSIPNRGFKYFQMAANNGDGHGLFVVATMYKNGEGVNRNINEANNYYRMAFYSGYKRVIDELNELKGML